MPEYTTVTARLERHIKEEAETVIAAAGLRPSQVVSILFAKIADERRLPFELFPPTPTREAAAREKIARRKTRSKPPPA